jgi:anti-sigma factor RsiW
MDCERYLEELGEELQGGVPPVQLRTHLESCPACKRFHDSLRRGRAILRSIPDIPVSNRFVDRLEQRIHRRETRRRVARRAVGAVGRFAIAGAVVAVVYLLAPAFAGRLTGPGHQPRLGERGMGLPAVAVLRPLSRLAGSAEASLFAGPADFEPEKGGPASTAQAVPFTRLISAGVAWSGAGAQTWPSSAALYRRQASPGAPQPVLVTTPSWTFAAPPASFHFVSARALPTFPIPAR